MQFAAVKVLIHSLFADTWGIIKYDHGGLWENLPETGLFPWKSIGFPVVLQLVPGTKSGVRNNRKAFKRTKSFWEPWASLKPRKVVLWPWRFKCYPRILGHLSCYVHYPVLLESCEEHHWDHRNSWYVHISASASAPITSNESNDIQITAIIHECRFVNRSWNHHRPPSSITRYRFLLRSFF